MFTDSDNSDNNYLTVSTGVTIRRGGSDDDDLLSFQQAMFSIVSDGGKFPVRGSTNAAGFDLYAVNGGTIASGTQSLVGTGVRINLPDGYFGKIEARSGLALRHWLRVAAGVIDSDYEGEIKVMLFNHGPEAFQFSAGDRIAQIIVQRHETWWAKDAVMDHMPRESQRGTGGFGSTGR